jgi:hypothetical protein
MRQCVNRASLRAALDTSLLVAPNLRGLEELSRLAVPRGHMNGSRKRAAHGVRVADRLPISA